MERILIADHDVLHLALKLREFLAGILVYNFTYIEDAVNNSRY